MYNYLYIVTGQEPSFSADEILSNASINMSLKLLVMIYKSLGMMKNLTLVNISILTAPVEPVENLVIKEP